MEVFTFLPETRGARNNNWLNIRRNKVVWMGMVLDGEDKSFCSFETVFWGLRAALVLLRTYYDKYGCDTIRKVIERWAPPSENDTNRYINQVVYLMRTYNASDFARVGPDSQFRLHSAADRDFVVCMLASMAMIESNISWLMGRFAFSIVYDGVFAGNMGK